MHTCVPLCFRCGAFARTRPVKLKNLEIDLNSWREKRARRLIVGGSCTQSC